MGQFPVVANPWPYISVAVPLIALLLNVLVQIFLVRFRKGTHFLRAVVEAFVVGLIVIGVCETWMIANRGNTGETLITALLVNIPIYICLSYCFFNFVNLGQSSIRIRIYSRVLESPQGVRIETVLEEYNEAALARTRLQRLFESGDLVKIGDQCHIGRSRLVNAGAPVFFLKKFLLGKLSEFE